jgi:membrane dipeptidase
LGRELLGVMGDLNMILDLSHLAEEAYFQAVEIYDGPLLASHSNPRRFVDSDRQLSDDMIRRLAERDSVMGIVAYNRFLKQGWKPETDKKSDVTVGVMLDMIDHVCQLTGSARHVGIGTDWDGGFGWESIPTPFDSHIDLWLMRDFLLKRQYSKSDVSQILSGNFLRILKQGLPT